MPEFESDSPATRSDSSSGVGEIPRLSKPISTMTDAELDEFIERLRGSRSMAPQKGRGMATAKKKEPTLGQTTW